MPNILFVDACPRRGESRTLMLAESLLSELRRHLPDVQITEQRLPDMHLASVDAATLAYKESLCDRHHWDDPLIAPALAFQQADAVIIAAPYWDMSFPSILKVWVENMYVRNLTFCYRNDQSVGLVKGKVCAYVTTAGSPIGEHDWGTAYIRDVMHTLGIPGFHTLKAEALDLASSDPEAILAAARREVPALATAIAEALV